MALEGTRGASRNLSSRERAVSSGTRPLALANGEGAPEQSRKPVGEDHVAAGACPGTVCLHRDEAPGRACVVLAE
jgi:hypothetical protein